MAFKVAAVLFLSIGALLDFAVCECNFDTIQSCIRSFPYLDILHQTTNLTAFPSTCSQLTVVNNCLKSQGCDSADVTLIHLWTGTNDSFSYLCNDGKAGLTQFQTCLTNTSYNVDAGTCIENISQVGLFESEDSTNFVAKCKYQNTQFACYVNLAQSDCNSGDFVTNYYKKYYKPSMSQIGCALEPKDQVSINQCNYIKLGQCSSRLTDKVSTGHGFESLSLIGEPFNISRIPDICNALNNATSCIQSVSGCDSSDINGNYDWISASNVWSYICKDGQAGMVQFQKCFLSTSTFANRSAACSDQKINGSQTPTVSCQYYNSQLACEALAAKDGCNSEQFVANVFVKGFTQTLKIYSPNCALSYNPSTGTMSMVTRSNGITLATILLSVYLGHNY